MWQKCPTIGDGCDIYAAIQTAPGVFTTTALTGSAGEDRDPDTNGQMAVYTSTRDDETDIYLQPLTGGAETRLSIPGDQRDVNISGELISFESHAQPGGVTQYDIFVYDVSTRSLYRVTDTPVNETQSDIAVCDGTARIVYAAPGTGTGFCALSNP